MILAQAASASLTPLAPIALALMLCGHLTRFWHLVANPAGLTTGRPSVQPGIGMHVPYVMTQLASPARPVSRILDSTLYTDCL